MLLGTCVLTTRTTNQQIIVSIFIDIRLSNVGSRVYTLPINKIYYYFFVVQCGISKTLRYSSPCLLVLHIFLVEKSIVSFL